MSLRIDGLSPEPVKVGWEGTLTIYGSDLGEAGFVTIDGEDPSIESWAATRIAVKITKDVTATATNKRLVVHDKNGNFGETQWRIES